MSNLLKRTLSILLLAPLFIMLVYAGGIPFFILVVLMFFVMLYEWSVITRKSKRQFLWLLFGMFYIGTACFVMLFIERMRYDFMGIHAVPIILFTLFALVWINDIFSFIFGKAIGGPKLAPKISPNKTWAGAIGGVVSCVGFFFLMSYLSSDSNAAKDKIFITALIIHIAVPVVAQIGDLFESYVKRKFGVKDSGAIIPGHGGLLDRMDGLILVMNVTGILIYINFAMHATALK